MLKGEQALGKCELIVAGQDVDARLRNHRATIQFGGHEVHAGAVHDIARFQCTTMCMQAAVLGQQGRVDIDHPPDPGLQGFAIDDAHEAGQHQHLGAAGIQATEQLDIEVVPVGVILRVEREGGDAGIFRQLQCACFRLVAADYNEVDRQLAGITRSDQGLQIAAAPGGEHGNAKTLRCHGLSRCERARRPGRARSRRSPNWPGHAWPTAPRHQQPHHARG